MMDDLIAPCGMNCRLCVAYQFREKDLNKKGYHRKYCPGCLPVCGGVICCHNGLCLDCDLDSQKDGRKASIDLSIRKTKPADLSRVMDIYSDARAFMKEQDNPDQWKDHHPPASLIEEDIRLGKSHVCTRNQEIVGVFYFSLAEEDPSYSMIYEGQWLNDEPYGVIHRIAVVTRRLGIASFVLDWCWNCCRNIRIDTHENNQPMQQLLKRKGFSHCGVILLADGSPRLAYQKPSNRK